MRGTLGHAPSSHRQRSRYRCSLGSILHDHNCQSSPVQLIRRPSSHIHVVSSKRRVPWVSLSARRRMRNQAASRSLSRRGANQTETTGTGLVALHCGTADKTRLAIGTTVKAIRACDGTTLQWAFSLLVYTGKGSFLLLLVVVRLDSAIKLISAGCAMETASWETCLWPKSLDQHMCRPRCLCT